MKIATEVIQGAVPRGRRQAESFARTRDEINAEKAAALARIAGTLQGCITRLHDLRDRAGHLDGKALADAQRAYGRTREKAKLYLWYLRIQREVLGFTDNRHLEEVYPIPGRLSGE